MLTYNFEDWRKRIAPKTLIDYPCKGCLFRGEDCYPCKNYDSYREWWTRWSKSIKSNYPCTECIVDVTCSLFCPNYEAWIKPRLIELPATLFRGVVIEKTNPEEEFKLVDSQWEYKPMMLRLPCYLSRDPIYQRGGLSWKWPGYGDNQNKED